MGFTPTKNPSVTNPFVSNSSTPLPIHWGLGSWGQVLCTPVLTCQRAVPCATPHQGFKPRHDPLVYSEALSQRTLTLMA